MIKPPIVLALSAIAVAGWVFLDHQQERERTSAKRADRAARQIANPTAPLTTTWQTTEGAFIQIEHRVPLRPGSTIMEVRRCFVWRDAVTNTSSMSCEPNPDLGHDPD